MHYVKLTVAYDGTNYNGFQRQKNGIGVQQVLEGALTELCGEEILLKAAGRTDTGVHALGQVVSFATESSVPASHIPRAIRHLLPGDIVVCQGEEVGKAFHARYSAKEKTYCYKVVLTDAVNPCLRNYAWEIKGSLDYPEMNKAAECLLGNHDFSAFRNTGSEMTTPIRTLTKAQWEKQGNALLFTITGNSFLYRMVRNIVGCLIKVGQGKLTPVQFAGIMEAKERKAVGMAAPAQGLYLMHVQY